MALELNAKATCDGCVYLASEPIRLAQSSKNSIILWLTMLVSVLCSFAVSSWKTCFFSDFLVERCFLRTFRLTWLEASKVKEITLLVNLVKLEANLDETIRSHRLPHSQVVDARVVVLPLNVASLHGFEDLVHDVLRLRLRSYAQVPFGLLHRLPGLLARVALISMRMRSITFVVQRSGNILELYEIEAFYSNQAPAKEPSTRNQNLRGMRSGCSRIDWVCWEK